MNPQRSNWRIYAQIVAEAVGFVLLLGMLWFTLVVADMVANT